MTALVQTYGLELNEYTPDQVIYSKADMAAQHGSTFIRKIDACYALSGLSLKEALAVADTEFNKVAELCGVSVVKHTWGFVKYEKPPRFGLPDSFGLPGCDLAAEVDTIFPDKERRFSPMLTNGLYRYHRGESGSSGWRWADTGLSQFSNGTTQTFPDSSYFLHDIDLYLKRAE